MLSYKAILTRPPNNTILSSKKINTTTNDLTSPVESPNLARKDSEDFNKQKAYQAKLSRPENIKNSKTQPGERPLAQGIERSSNTHLKKSSPQASPTPGVKQANPSKLSAMLPSSTSKVGKDAALHDPKLKSDRPPSNEPEYSFPGPEDATAVSKTGVAAVQKARKPQSRNLFDVISNSVFLALLAPPTATATSKAAAAASTKPFVHLISQKEKSESPLPAALESQNKDSNGAGSGGTALDTNIRVFGKKKKKKMTTLKKLLLKERILRHQMSLGAVASTESRGLEQESTGAVILGTLASDIAIGAEQGNTPEVSNPCEQPSIAAGSTAAGVGGVGGDGGNETQTDDRLSESGIVSGTAWPCCLRLVNFISEDELADEDETVEVLANAAVLVEQFPGMGPPYTCCALQDGTDEKSWEVRIDCEKLATAQAAVSTLNGMILGGAPLLVLLDVRSAHGDTSTRDALGSVSDGLGSLSVVDCSLGDSRLEQQVDIVKSECLDAFYDESMGDVGLEPIPITHNTSTRADVFMSPVLKIKDLISPEDVYDPDECAEVLSDLAALCSLRRHGSVQPEDVQPESVWIEVRTSDIVQGSSMIVVESSDSSITSTARQSVDVNTSPASHPPTLGVPLSLKSVRSSLCSHSWAEVCSSVLYPCGILIWKWTRSAVLRGRIRRAGSLLQSAGIDNNARTKLLRLRTIAQSPSLQGTTEDFVVMLWQGSLPTDDISASRRDASHWLSLRLWLLSLIGLDLNSSDADNKHGHRGDDVQLPMTASFACSAEELHSIVQNCMTGSSGESSRMHSSAELESLPSSTILIGCVSFTDVASAMLSALAMDGTVVAGKTVSVWLADNAVTTSSEYTDNDNDTDTDADLLVGIEALKPYAPEQPTPFTASTACKEDSVTNSSSSLTPISPSETTPYENASKSQLKSLEVEVEADQAGTSSLHTPTPIASAAVLSSASLRERALIQATPKLPKRNSLILVPAGESSAGDDASDGAAANSPTVLLHLPQAEDAVNEMIVKMLNSLADFQRRAQEKNAQNAKLKQRFVLGIKQGINSVRADKAKVVFLAPDTEAANAIDAKLATLVSEAQERRVPVLYCLSRRKLGRAVGSSMKQSAITVFDADGVYDMYRDIVTSVGASVVTKNEY